MSLSADQITIAVTVYDRRTYIEQAIQSALDQTLPVKVIVVEDCGPDPGLKSFVEGKFGNRIEYFRNERRRGLFDNWNACIEFCKTPFLSILHDDDFLDREFVAAMKELVGFAPDCGLYFGQTIAVDTSGEILRQEYPSLQKAWRKVTLSDFARSHLRSFPGQLFPVHAARAVGGFRPTSLYCGDVEMWVKLTSGFAAVQTERTVAYVRHHFEWGRGTSRVERSGKLHGLLCVQQKRTLAKMREKGEIVFFSRKEMLNYWPISIKTLIRSAVFFSRRLLVYNYCLLIQSQPPNWKYALFQKLARPFGPSFLKFLSKFFRFWTRVFQSQPTFLIQF